MAELNKAGSCDGYLCKQPSLFLSNINSDNGVRNVCTGLGDEVFHCEYKDGRDNRGLKRTGRGKNEMRWKRNRGPAEGASHILRERQRRDDMSDKFATLETFLPQKSKRDRATIVDDAIDLVKEMQGTLFSLENQMKYQHNSSVPARNYVNQNMLKSLQDCFSFDANNLYIHVSSDKITGEVTIDISSNIVRPRFMTNLIMAMEELHLDVCHCNYSKHSSHIICIVIAKVLYWMTYLSLFLCFVSYGIIDLPLTVVAVGAAKVIAFSTVVGENSCSSTLYFVMKYE